MIELYQLHQLAAIEKYGNLSRAAQSLHISQPALTRSVQKLEGELGVELFSRSRNKIEFNEAGRLALTEAHKVIDAAANMTEQMELYRRNLSSVSIGSCAPAPVWEMTSVLMSGYPDKRVITEIRTCDFLTSGLKSGQYTLIATDKPVDESGILCRPYFRESLLISFPEDHPLASRTGGVSCEDLEGETMLLADELGIWKNLVDQKMKRVHFIEINRDIPAKDMERLTAFPNFVTGPTLRHASFSFFYFNQIRKRITVPLLDPDASKQFYLSARRSDQKIWNAVLSSSDYSEYT